MEKLQQQIFAELRAAEKRWVTPKTPILRPRDSSPVLNTPRQLAVPAPEPNRNKDTPKAAAFTMPFSGILAGKLRQLIRPEIVDSVIAVIRKIEQQPSKSPEGQAIPGPSLKPPPNPTDKTGKTG